MPFVLTYSSAAVKLTRGVRSNFQNLVQHFLEHGWDSFSITVLQANPLWSFTYCLASVQTAQSKSSSCCFTLPLELFIIFSSLPNGDEFVVLTLSHVFNCNMSKNVPALIRRHTRVLWLSGWETLVRWVGGCARFIPGLRWRVTARFLS